MTWNGQWLAHRYSRFFNEVDNMSGFNPYTIKNDEFSIDTVSWTRILIGIAQKCPNKQMMGYIYSYGQTNTTIGFIPFDLSQIASPVKLYQRFLEWNLVIKQKSSGVQLWDLLKHVSKG